MATFYYRALTDDGRIVSNKVEEGNRLTLVNKLKENGLHPISIQQRNAKRTKVLKKRKEIFQTYKTYWKMLILPLF